jgi:hypothetical protein
MVISVRIDVVECRPGGMADPARPSVLNPLARWSHDRDRPDRASSAVLAADVADTVRLSITQIGRTECCSDDSLFDRSTFYA